MLVQKGSKRRERNYILVDGLIRFTMGEQSSIQHDSELHPATHPGESGIFSHWMLGIQGRTLLLDIQWQ